MSAEADHIIGLYRRHALAWAKHRGSDLKEKKWLAAFVERLGGAPSVLDLGCGSGQPIGRYLVDHGCALTGVDASPELIDIARDNIPRANWIVSDMRSLALDARYDGILAWNSTFHLAPDDQRTMFKVFKRHAASGAVLMFTSGPSHAEEIGVFEGEALYHSSLDAHEYRMLLNQNGFDVVDHVVEDPECGLQTVWLASFRAAA